MEDKMEDKIWWKSRTVWAGVIIAAYGIANSFTDLSAYTELIISVASGLGIVGIRSAIAKK